MGRTTTAISSTVLALAMSVPVAAAAGPHSNGGSDTISTSGQCSAGSTWTLSGRSRFLRVVVDARVQTDRSRQRWVLRLQHNQATVAALARKPTGRGVVKVKGRVRNQPGSDTFTFVARNRSTAEICQGTLTF